VPLYSVLIFSFSAHDESTSSSCNVGIVPIKGKYSFMKDVL